MLQSDTYTIEASIAFFVFVLAYKAYHSKCHIHLDEEEEVEDSMSI
jgi:hypothetical protein